jgi:hypothetical protein
VIFNAGFVLSIPVLTDLSPRPYHAFVHTNRIFLDPGLKYIYFPRVGDMRLGTLESNTNTPFGFTESRANEPLGYITN